MAPPCLKTYAGLILEVISLLVIACSYLLFKALSGIAADFYIFNVYVLQTGFFTSYAVFTYPKTVVTVDLYGERYLHIARGVTGCVAYILVSVALQLIPAADVSAILKSASVFVTILAYFLLKERFGPLRLGVLVLTIFGVVLICRPTFIFGSTGDSGDRVVGTLCAVVACILLSLLYVIQRKISRTPVVITSLANAIICVLLLAPVVLYRRSWLTVDCGHAGTLFVCCACVLVGIALKFKASRMEEAGRLALVSVVDLPFVLVAEIIFFGTKPLWTSYAGAGVITVSILLVVILKRKETATLVVASTELLDVERKKSCDGRSAEKNGESHALV